MALCDQGRVVRAVNKAKFTLGSSHMDRLAIFSSTEEVMSAWNNGSALLVCFCMPSPVFLESAPSP